MGQEQIDYIIVGAGLAGVTLATHLHNAGKRVLMFSGTQKNVSSYVAAGLYNPVTGRKMVKTWKADQLFPYLEDYYRNCEELSRKKFLHLNAIYRPFVDVEEQNEWMGKSTETGYSDFIQKVYTQPTTSQVNDPYGGLLLNLAGYLDIPEYIEGMMAFLSRNHTIVNDDFKYNKLVQGEDSVYYGAYQAKEIIFCEGIGLNNNPYFDWLPLRPVKGEILYIKSEFEPDYILNRGVFVLPIGDGVYKVGSTYDHHDQTLEPTEKAKNQILEKLDLIFNEKYEIVDHIAGIRPATKDRRPFVGIHPKHETIGVFNGLGTKGVSLAPYWAQHLVQFLEHNEKLSDEVNISRYFSLYSESHAS